MPKCGALAASSINHNELQKLTETVHRNPMIGSLLMQMWSKERTPMMLAVRIYEVEALKKHGRLFHAIDTNSTSREFPYNRFKKINFKKNFF
jgi:hypothetical protein